MSNNKKFLSSLVWNYWNCVKKIDEFLVIPSGYWDYNQAQGLSRPYSFFTQYIIVGWPETNFLYS